MAKLQTLNVALRLEPGVIEDLHALAEEQGVTVGVLVSYMAAIALGDNEILEAVDDAIYEDGEGEEEA
ncbi:MAG: hypothetical protein RBJ76_13280 [Stenomitos frigidus ULC029]